jgi:hypothetical protein
MKTTLLLIPALAAFMTSAWGGDRIYRCGNEYTNTVSDEQAKNCKLLSGGNVTIVQAQKPLASGLRSGIAGATGSRSESAEQRAKSTDARLILEAELKKAEAQQAELLKEYNNGEPEKLGPEAHNYQKYLDRVAELKSGIARNEDDIASIRRELSRLPSAGVAAAKARE